MQLFQAGAVRNGPGPNFDRKPTQIDQNQNLDFSFLLHFLVRMERYIRPLIFERCSFLGVLRQALGALGTHRPAPWQVNHTERAGVKSRTTGAGFNGMSPLEPRPRSRIVPRPSFSTVPSSRIVPFQCGFSFRRKSTQRLH